jgi:hypothetical protein
MLDALVLDEASQIQLNVDRTVVDPDQCFWLDFENCMAYSIDTQGLDLTPMNPQGRYWLIRLAS